MSTRHLLFALFMLASVAFALPQPSMLPFAANRSASMEYCWNDTTYHYQHILTSDGTNLTMRIPKNPGNTYRLWGQIALQPSGNDTLSGLSLINISRGGDDITWPNGTTSTYSGGVETGVTVTWTTSNYTEGSDCKVSQIINISRSPYNKCYNLTGWWLGQAYVRDRKEFNCSTATVPNKTLTSDDYTNNWPPLVVGVHGYHSRDNITKMGRVLLFNSSYYLNTYFDEAATYGSETSTSRVAYSASANTGWGFNDDIIYNRSTDGRYNPVSERFIIAFSPRYLDVIPYPMWNTTPTGTWQEGDWAGLAGAWNHWNTYNSQYYANTTDYLWPARMNVQNWYNMGLRNLTYRVSDIHNKSHTEFVPFNTRYYIGSLCNYTKSIGFDCSFYYSPQDSEKNGTLNKYNGTEYNMLGTSGAAITGFASNYFVMKYGQRALAIFNLLPNMTAANMQSISLDTLVNPPYVYVDFNKSSSANLSYGRQLLEQAEYLSNISQNMTVYCEECNEPYYIAGLVDGAEGGWSTSGYGWIHSPKYIDVNWQLYNPIMKQWSPYKKRWANNTGNNASAKLMWEYEKSRITWSLINGFYPFLDNTPDWGHNTSMYNITTDYYALYTQLPWTIGYTPLYIQYRNASGSWLSLDDYIKTNSTPKTGTAINLSLNSGWNAVANFNTTAISVSATINNSVHVFNINQNAYLGWNGTTYVYFGYQNNTDQLLAENNDYAVVAFFNGTRNWTPINAQRYFLLYNLTQWNKQFIGVLQQTGGGGDAPSAHVYTLLGVDDILGYDEALPVNFTTTFSSGLGTENVSLAAGQCFTRIIDDIPRGATIYEAWLNLSNEPSVTSSFASNTTVWLANNTHYSSNWTNVGTYINDADTATQNWVPGALPIAYAFFNYTKPAGASKAYHYMYSGGGSYVTYNQSPTECFDQTQVMARLISEWNATSQIYYNDLSCWNGSTWKQSIRHQTVASYGSTNVGEVQLIWTINNTNLTNIANLTINLSSPHVTVNTTVTALSNDSTTFNLNATAMENILASDNEVNVTVCSVTTGTINYEGLNIMWNQFAQMNFTSNWLNNGSAINNFVISLTNTTSEPSLYYAGVATNGSVAFNITKNANYNILVEWESLGVNLTNYSFFNASQNINYTLVYHNFTFLDAYNGSVIYPNCTLQGKNLSTGSAFITSNHSGNATLSCYLEPYANLSTNIDLDNTTQNHTLLMGFVTLWVNIYDEDTLALVKNQVTLDIIGSINSSNASSVNGTINLTSLLSGDYQILYSASGYLPREYHFTIGNGSSTTINLYLLNDTRGVNATNILYDEVGATIEGYYIRLLRYYVSTNTFVQVDMVKTNFEGIGMLRLVLDDEYYKFQITDIGGTTYSMSQSTKVYDTLLKHYISLKPEFGNYFQMLQGVSFALEYLNATGQFKFTFTNTDGNVVGAQLLVYQIRSGSPLSEYLVNSSSLNASSGIIYAGIPGQEYAQYVAYAMLKYGDNEDYTHVSSLTHDISQVVGAMGTMGLFLTGLVILAVSLLGMWQPTVALILAPVALIMTRIGGLHGIEWTWISGLTGLAIVMIIIIRNKS